MKTGFPADEATIGGRIRKARLNAGYMIKDFAPLIDVSPNHLGLLERGKKQVSVGLLQKIAWKTNTSYQWLLNGDQEPPPQKEYNIMAPADTTESLNLRLYLGLILALAPTINKEVLVSLLSTLVETIDCTPCGDDVAREQQWPSQFTTLASLLGDIPTVRKGLQDLERFLAEVEFDCNMNVLTESLIQFLFNKYQKRYKLYQPISHQSQSYSFTQNYTEKQFEVTWTIITLYDTDNIQSVWHFGLFRTQDTLDEEAMKMVFDAVSDGADSMVNNLTILFASKNEYDTFADIANRSMDRIYEMNAGYDALGWPVSVAIDEDYVLKNLSYALVNSSTWQIDDLDMVNPQNS